MVESLTREEIARIVGGNQRAIKLFERLINTVQANINGPSAITVNYTNAGVLVDTLPIITPFTLVPENGVAYTSGVSWGVTVLSGMFTGAAPTIGGTGTGYLRFGSDPASNTVTLAVTAKVAGRGYPPYTVTVSKSLAGLSGSGGGLTPGDSVASFNTFSTGAFAPITRDLAVTLPGGVTSATLTAAALSLRLSNAAPEGSTTSELRWTRESPLGSGTWVLVGSVATSSPDAFVTETFDPPLFIQTPGNITCNATATGLVAGSAQKFRLEARVSGGNARTVTPIGTASVSS